MVNIGMRDSTIIRYDLWCTSCNQQMSKWKTKDLWKDGRSIGLGASVPVMFEPTMKLGFVVGVSNCECKEHSTTFAILDGKLHLAVSDMDKKTFLSIAEDIQKRFK